RGFGICDERVQAEMVNHPHIRTQPERQPKAQCENKRIDQLENLHFYLAVSAQHGCSLGASYRAITKWFIKSNLRQAKARGTFSHFWATVAFAGAGVVWNCGTATAIYFLMESYVASSCP